MKTLSIGFLVFIVWSAFSTYFYVCKIKGLCAERINDIEVPVVSEKALTNDSLPDIKTSKPSVIPENLSVYFDFDKSDFKSSAKADSNIVASGNYLLQNSDSRLNITGHTDGVGSEEYNMALGLRRAESVKEYFLKKGMAQSKIIITTKGETEAAETNNTISGRSKNRRVVITIKN